MWNLTYDTDGPIYGTDSDMQDRLVPAKEERWSGSLGLAEARCHIERV